MVITLVNFKGGCGKTSLASLLALYWAEKGKETAIWDRDRQGSAEAFVAHIEHEKIVDYQEGEEYDHILIDTPGGLKAGELKKLVDVSDLILIPFQLSPTDMRSTGETVRHLGGVDKARLIFNRVNRATAIYKDRRNYAEVLGVKALKNHLGDRVSFKHALVDGWSALNGKAKEE